jgi:hypothetical protein
MKLKIATVALMCILGSSSAASAEEMIGEIVYLEEGVEISRNGDALDPDSVYIGAGIENYDLMRTDSTGYAEVQLAPRGSGGASLKVSPNTTFAFEVNRYGKENRSSVGLITGSLAVKVQKLTGNQTLEVVTESALMGVRGTSFAVLISPAGEVLVSSTEGRVSCTDDEGRELYAQPGQVVEKLPGQSFRAIPVAVSSLEQFRRDWYAERLEVFKANALRAIRNYALRCLELRERFAANYAALLEEREVLRKWYDEDRRGRQGSSREIMREKKKILRHLLEIRKTLFVFERVYFRLVELERYFQQGYGGGALRPGLSTAEFFRLFGRDRQTLARQMAEVRYITKLYASRNDGRFPTDRFEEGEEDFFGEELSF